MTLGVFHLPKDSGKFRKLQWEMFIGEERVPFDTLVPFIPRLPSPSDVFPAKIQNGGTTFSIKGPFIFYGVGGVGGIW